MGLAKLLVPALALASSAFAQGGGSGGNSPCSGTKTIQNAGDATSLASCPTFSGSISFATGVAGQIQLNGVRKITGDLTLDSVGNLTSLSADSLATIGGTFDLTKTLQLSSLDMPYLASVDTIKWAFLPQLQGLQFATGVSKVNTLNIQASSLSTLQGINITSAQTINLANNQYLSQISIPVKEVTMQLSISGNGPQLSASFPQLTTANTIYVTNVSTLDLGALQNASGSVFLGGNRFTNVSLPKLTQSDGLGIANNNDLKTIDLPVYQSSTGAFRVENNTALNGQIGFPALNNVGGAARFFGGFSGLSLPKIQTVAGDMTIYATNTDATNLCNGFNSHGYVQGTFNCDPVGASSSGGASPSGTSSSSSSSSKSAAMSVQPAASAMGLSMALAGLIGMLL